MTAVAKIGMKLMSVVIGVPVGYATKKVVERVWAAARPDAPPRRPTEAGVRWGDAVGWASLSAAGIVVADLLTRRGAEVAYQAITGNAPPPGKPAKGVQSLQRAAEKSPATAE